MAEEGKITVICGANNQVLEGIEEITVADLRQRLADVMNIPNPSQAIVGGQTVNDEAVLQPGSQIEFVKPAGSKGR